MKVIFLTAALAAIPSVSDAKSEHYLLSQLNKTPVEEVIQTASEKRDTRRIVRSDRRKPVRTFLKTRIKNLKWHPVGNTFRRLKGIE